ncbi:MAG: DNA repair protein RecO [Coriobacteriia bacterium]|nr:DNA repair protein RecO [Coriobacteriia bacterium]
MASKSSHVAGLILSATKLKETDLILTILSESGEQIRAVAHGARKPGCKFGARTEVFTHAKLLIRKGRNLDTLQEIQTINTRACLRTDILFSAPASVIASFAQKMSYPDAKEATLFAMTQAALDSLESLHQAFYANTLDEPSLINATRLLVSAYIFKIFALHGYMPQTKVCVLCGESLSDILKHNEHTDIKLSAHAGGFVCKSCSPGAHSAHVVQQNLHEWLYALLYSSFQDILTFEVDTKLADTLLLAASWWSEEYLGERVKALEFFIEF